MKSLKSLYTIIDEYSRQCLLLDATSEEEYKKNDDELVDRFTAEVNQLRDVCPGLLQVNCGDSGEDEIEMELLKLSVLAANSDYYSVPYLGHEYETIYDDDHFEVPGVIEWQHGTRPNFYIEQDTNSCLERLLFNMMISLPKGKLHITFVDLGLSGTGSIFYRELNRSGICEEPITSSQNLRDAIASWQKRHIEAIQKYGDIVSYNEEHKTIAIPYEVIVLLDYSERYECDRELQSLFVNGHKSGLYFIVCKSNADISPDNSCLLSQKDYYQSYSILQGDNYCIPIAECTPYYDIDILRDSFFEYYGEVVEDSEENTIVKTPSEKLYDEPYAVGACDIKVPIGESNGETKDFIFDTISHPHAFIIGQSGSGKSVLLHNVISGMILRYAPEDLQLYLLDFKMGGVEFNRYRSLKHVKALLVDNSDILITLEILRDIDSQMKERGKLLRDAGVSNINDYNKTNVDKRMPSIVLVADECHVMFSTQDSKSRRIQTEINNIITKIAKEGRSQGVHLLLATQTLAGTDISNEVMNNITDHYLLKCAPSDSEKMASNSSSITSGLSTGQVYYHHTDAQHQFKAFYSTKEQLADIVSKAEQKSKTNASNGQFYFSGAQIFNIDEDVIQHVGTKGRKNPVVAVGRGISLDESPISITLKQDFSENILVFGINDDEQVTRTTLNALITLASSNVQKGLDMDFFVFDCLNNDEGRYVEALDELESKGLCKIVSGRKRGALLKQLVEQISSDTANPTALFILGQERFRELKMDMPLEEEKTEMADGGLMAGLSFGNEKPQVKTYQEAMKFILERGPECGVHTVFQIDKPDKLLFSEYSVTSKDVFKMFKHLIMHRSDENAATRIVDNEIKLETLSGDNERLRAFYYSEEEDRYTLFTPYEMPTKEDVNKFF